MGKKESIVENYLVKQAKKFGYDCPKFTSPGSNGYPDRVLIGHGLTIFAEVKSNEGSLQEIQKVVIREMRKKGAIVLVPSSKTEVDEIFELLNHLTKNKLHKAQNISFLNIKNDWANRPVK